MEQSIPQPKDSGIRRLEKGGTEPVSKPVVLRVGAKSDQVLVAPFKDGQGNTKAAIAYQDLNRGIAFKSAYRNNPVTIGRSSASDVPVTNTNFSREHARVDCTSGNCQVIDGGSKSSTNGSELPDVAHVQPGRTEIPGDGSWTRVKLDQLKRLGVYGKDVTITTNPIRGGYEVYSGSSGWPVAEGQPFAITYDNSAGSIRVVRNQDYYPNNPASTVVGVVIGGELIYTGLPPSTEAKKSGDVIITENFKTLPSITIESADNKPPLTLTDTTNPRASLQEITKPK